MELSGERDGDILVLTPEGRIDGSNSADFQSAVMERIDDGAESILLDFAGISYISSAGLRAVLILAKKLNQVNGRFALCSMQGVGPERVRSQRLREDHRRASGSTGGTLGNAVGESAKAPFPLRNPRVDPSC